MLSTFQRCQAFAHAVVGGLVCFGLGLGLLFVLLTVLWRFAPSSSSRLSGSTSVCGVGGGWCRSISTTTKTLNPTPEPEPAFPTNLQLYFHYLHTSTAFKQGIVRRRGCMPPFEGVQSYGGPKDPSRAFSEPRNPKPRLAVSELRERKPQWRTCSASS